MCPAFPQKKIENRLNLWYTSICKIMLGKGLTRMAARGSLIPYVCIVLPFFSVKSKTAIFLKDFFKGVFCPIYHGRDAPFLRTAKW